MRGYIDKTGAWVIPPRFSWAGPFSGGVAEVGLDSQPRGVPFGPMITGGKSGYIDKTGRILFEWEWDVSGG